VSRVDFQGFLAIVGERADLSTAEAERAAQAVLQTLGERLSVGQARDLADELPPELRPWVLTDRRPDPFHADEFLRRVAARENVDPVTAGRHARAVFAALGRSVSHRELADATAELPRDFEPLLASAYEPRPPSPEAEAIVEEVADHAGSDRQTAERALDAVLETLGERISGGEVDDLAAELPEPLRQPLKRGDAASNGAARPLSLQEFLRHVAEREGVTPDQAQQHARAVFLTLRESVSEKEFSDMAAQLPDEYTVLMARR
jgi:uncharacterized protein (DUF2267 family)